MKAGTLLALFVLVAACGHGTPSGPADAAPSVSAGLGAAGNDPAVVALANKALACSWGPSGMMVVSTGPECPGWKAWLDGVDARAVAPSATYLNMLDDVDPRVRSLAVPELTNRTRTDWETNPLLAKRVVVAASKEPADRVAIYGVALASIDFTKTDLWLDVRNLVDGSASPTLLVSALEQILRPASNAQNDDVWSWVKSKLDAPKDNVSAAALASFTNVTDPARHKQICPIFADALKNDRLAGHAITWATDPHDDCDDLLDPSVALAEKWLEAGKLPTSELALAQALNWVAVSPKASAATKSRALAALEKLTSSAASKPSQRAAALKDIYAIDKKRGAALAKKLESDPSPDVSKAAKDIIAKGS